MSRNAVLVRSAGLKSTNNAPSASSLSFRLFSASASDDITDSVKDQYNTKGARVFYRTVMGGGEGNIHYGVYRNMGATRADPSVSEAAQNTVDFMGDLLDVVSRGSIGNDSKVLDVGSGHGGAAHSNIQRFGCHVTGFNLCKDQNIEAEEHAAKISPDVAAKFTTDVGNFDEGFPDAYKGKFDAVWSEEVFCHSNDKVKLLGNISQLLKDEGVLVFSDIMAGQDATAEQIRTFTDRNATAVMSRPSDYQEAITAAGLSIVTYADLTDHLTPFFQGMINQIDTHHDSMKGEGVTEEYMANFRQSLVNRIGAANEGCFSWGVFAAKKRVTSYQSSFLAKDASNEKGGLDSFSVSGRT